MRVILFAAAIGFAAITWQWWLVRVLLDPPWGDGSRELRTTLLS